MNIPVSKPEPFDVLLDAYVEDLIAMSREQALDGVDPDTMRQEGLALLDKAREIAGSRRLDLARAELSQHKAQTIVTVMVSVEEARRFLVKATNDSRYTLAARELKEMSDEEILLLYEQVKRLEGEQAPPSNSR